MNTKLRSIFGDSLMNVAYFLADRSCRDGLLWKILFGIYKFFLSIWGMKVLPIISIIDYWGRTNSARTIVKHNRMGVSTCSSLPFDTNEVYQIKLNDLCITKLNNVLISSGSDSIINDSKSYIINDFCVNKSPNIYCSDSVLCREKGNWGLVRRVINREPKKIETGIMISGKYSHNYYHCMFENLNKCLLIDDNLIPAHIPILVDKDTLSIPSLKKAISFMTIGKSREIIPIEMGEIYKCKSLYYIDHPHYIIPHHRKMMSIPTNELSYYDIDLLKLQRDVLLAHKSKTPTPKRVFITRASSASRHYNEDEIFNIVKEWGFEKIAPETLSFDEQIALFNNAEYIIGGTGAAFSNVLFCRKGCKIICFRPIQTNEGTPLFKTIAYANGAEFWHYCSDSALHKGSVHSNYYISPTRFKSTMVQLMNMSQTII